jgi:tetratricopeptide (TPR) repeat protein
MKKYILTILLGLSIMVSAVFAQTRQQALDEIARIEKVPEMLRQAWEAGRTQTDTVIDTPYGKVSIKFNLDEIIHSTYTGSELTFKLRNWHGSMGGNELRLNNGGSWKNSTFEGMKATITHELGHHIADRDTAIAPAGKYRTVTDISEINADAFAMRYIGKSDYTAALKNDSSSQSYIDLVIKRAEEMEREERETLARLRTIANAPAASTPASSPPAAAAQKPSVNTAQELAESAMTAFGRKDYDKAIADYTQAIRIDPKFATAYSNRGSAYGMKGDYDKAIADFTKAMELNPGIMYLYSNRGVAYFEKGDYDKAMVDYNQQIRIDPNLAQPYSGRGNVYYKRNDLDRALADHNQAIRLDPNLALAYSNRGLVYEAKRDHDRAMADYNQAIRLDPNLVEAYSNRGLVYQRKGDHDRAMADYNQAIRINPNYADAYQLRGTVYFEKGELDKAIAEYNQAIRLKPKDPDNYKLRGMAYFQKKDIDRTIADFEAALRLAPNDNEVKNILDMARQLKQMKK